MKKLIVLLSLAYSLQSWAQDPRLLDNTWYLQKVTIDDIHYYSPYSFLVGEAYFEIDNMGAGFTYCEEYFGAFIFYDHPDIFNLEEDPVIIPGYCADPEIVTFIGRYFSIYFSLGPIPKNPFSYTIISDGNDVEILTVTNNEGNQAIFGNQILAINNPLSLDIRFYPNPVDDLLYISAINVDVLMVSILNLVGTEVVSFEKKNQSFSEHISLKDLESGIYFIKIVTDIGQTTKKLIKE